jgi:hypothetical protein
VDTRELDGVIAVGPLADDLDPTRETEVRLHEVAHVRGVVDHDDRRTVGHATEIYA